MTYATAMSFSRLNTLGLITDAQQDAAAAYSPRNVIGATASPAECLVWMIEKRIASHAELIELPFDGPDDADDAYWDELDDVVEDALEKCLALSGRMNAQLFGQLVADGYISEGQRRKAECAQFSLVLQTPAQALAHVVVTKAMPQADFDAMLGEATAEHGSADSGRRLRLLQDAAAEMPRVQKLYGPIPGNRRPRLHGGLRLLLGCAALVCGHEVYQFVNSVPFCGSSGIRDSVQLTLSVAAHRVEKRAYPDFPRLTQIKEVGHARVRGQRGCIATVTFKGKSRPYTYILEKIPTGIRNKERIISANRSIVEARFGNVGFDGDFGNKAEPIGRENLEAALRDGVNSMYWRPALMPKHIVPDVMGPFSSLRNNRWREIADIEPIGACRALQDGIRYGCRVMIEHNDSLLTRAGAGAEILDAEFTFERSSPDAQWRVTQDFPKTFARAIVKARTSVDAGARRD